MRYRTATLGPVLFVLSGFGAAGMLNNQSLRSVEAVMATPRAFTIPEPELATSASHCTGHHASLPAANVMALVTAHEEGATPFDHW